MVDGVTRLTEAVGPDVVWDGNTPARVGAHSACRFDPTRLFASQAPYFPCTTYIAYSPDNEIRDLDVSPRGASWSPWSGSREASVPRTSRCSMRPTAGG